MTVVHLDVLINAPATVIWEKLGDISTHTEWMRDAKAIRFLTDQHSGVGTTLECDTAFGPLRTTDLLTVTEWEENHRLEVQHRGLVTGTGAFTLVPAVTGTRLEWEERLHFPLRFGGPLGELIAKPLFKFVWKGNLRRFAAQF